jgi:hypothetical protein
MANPITFMHKFDDGNDEMQVGGLVCCTTLNPETVVATIVEMKDVFSATWLNVNTGPGKFNLAREFFCNGVRDAWDMVANDYTKTNANFLFALRDFLLQVMTPNVHSNQCSYQFALKELFNMKVTMFASRLHRIKELMKHLPRQANEPELTDDDINHIILQAMPNNFQDQYVVSFPQPLHEITVQELTERLSNIQSILDHKYASSQSNKRQKTKYNYKKQLSNHGNQSDYKRKGNNSNPNVCCIPGHQNHLWNDCCANCNSVNYDPNFMPCTYLSDQGGNHSNNNNNNNNHCLRSANHNNNHCTNLQQNYAINTRNGPPNHREDSQANTMSSSGTSNARDSPWVDDLDRQHYN